VRGRFDRPASPQAAATGIVVHLMKRCLPAHATASRTRSSSGAFGILAQCAAAARDSCARNPSCLSHGMTSSQARDEVSARVLTASRD